MALEGITVEALMRRGAAAQTIKDILVPIVESEKERLLLRLASSENKLEDLMLCKAEAITILNLCRQIDGMIRQGQRD